MGDRKWRFTAGVDVLSKEGTDFWLEYPSQYQSAGSTVLSIVLHSIWEQVNPALSNLDKRTTVEDRFKELQWTYVGRSGLLEIDYGTPRARSLAGITLRAVAPIEQSSNGMLEYDLLFEYPLQAGGTQIARALQFGSKPLAADNFICQYLKPDNTVFTDVFRAAPIRIPQGPPLKTIRVTAIKQAVTGATALAKRQAAEAEFQDWTWNWVGNQGLLFIDGLNKGTFHLRSANPGDLALPDALTYDLEFLTGYGT